MYTPIDTFRNIIKGKYKARILIYINDRSLRYSQIRRKFKEASERIIILQLKELESEGMIVKTVVGTKAPFKTEYTISEHGRTMCPILKQMWHWGEQHAKKINYHQM